MIAALSATGLALTLAACSAPEDDDGGSDGGASGSVEWWVPNWDEEAANELLEEFNEEHPDIEVETVITTWDTMANQIRVALDSGTVPDVITELTSRIQVYARADQLTDVSDWYDDEMPLDDFYEAAIETASLDGSIYGVPFRWDAGSMIYNIDLFDEAGLDGPPETWAETQDAAQALSEIGVYGYGWPYGNDNNARVRWLNEYYTQGGEFTETDDGAIEIDADASLRALEVLSWGFEEGFVSPSSLEASNTDLQNLFINEQIGFYFEGAYAIEPIREAGINVGTAMWPGTDGPGTVSADGFSLMVPEAAENLEAAQVLVQFLARPESQARMTETFPARESAAEDERFSEPLFEPFLQQHSEFALNRPSFAGWEELTPTIFAALQSVALGDMTPEEANATIIDHAELVLRTE